MRALIDQRMKTTPVVVPQSTRMHEVRAITSLPAGKMVPICAIPLLREDALRSSQFRLSFEMMETAEILMNAVNVDVKAYVVPTLAFERFGGSLDVLNRVYEGKVPYEGADPVPYIETAAFGAHGANKIYYHMGLHAAEDDQVNTMYLEAYNQIWNFRAKNRSPDISLRTRLQTDLAPAFWKHTQFKHIVPDFDDEIIDGAVPLNVTNARMPVKGLGISSTFGTSGTNSPVRETDGDGTVNYAAYKSLSNTSNGQWLGKMVDGYPDIWAELADNGITVSLANIELAKKTAAFARLRGQYTGHDDDYIIDLLMDGISVPDQHLKQPMLIGQSSTVFGMSKRYASDSGNLTESVVSGATWIDLRLRVPKLGTGGVVMIVAEITPEQLFERQADPFLDLQSVDELPQYLRDYLDPQKVEIVPNRYVDVSHGTPNGTFGYAPLNHKWNIFGPRVGGRFYRPEVDETFDEDRQRIWAVETEDPVLSEDFYLCTTMHTKPFVVTNQDPFECVTRGACVITGNTVFGPALIEASDDYQQVLAEAPMDNIDPDA